MPEVDSLTLRIEVDLSDLRSGLSEANRLVSESSRSMIQSLAGVEKSLGRIGSMSATLQPPVGKPERQISAEDRIAGAGLGATIAGGAAAIAVALGAAVAVTAAAITLALAAGAVLGAFIPDVRATLSDALAERSSAERLADLESRISQLQSMQGKRTDIEFGDATREKELAEKIDRLQKERSELLRLLEKVSAIPEAMDLGQGGTIGGSDSFGTLTGGAGGDILLTTERVEDLGTAFEGAGAKAENFAEIQSNGLDTLAQKSEETRNSIRNLDSAARDLGFTFASSFEDAVVKGRSLSDVLQGLEQDILRILTRKLVTEPLAGAVTGLIGSGLGVLSGEFHGGGRVGSASVSDRVVPASLFAGAPRFAGGGLVGRVPRLAPGEVPAILHRGEIVRTPAQEAALRRSGGGGDTQIVVNIQTPNPRAFNESRGQIQAMLADAVGAGRRNR